MGMSESNAAQELAKAYEANKDINSGRDNGTYMGLLNTILDNEFQNAATTAPNVLITNVAGTLDIQPVGYPILAKEIATKCCAYWSKTIVPSPSSVSGYGVSSVSNDAMSYVSMLTDALLAIDNNTLQRPDFLSFTTTIFNHCRMIKWTVDENKGGTHTTLIL